MLSFANDFSFITFNASESDFYERLRRGCAEMKVLMEKDAQQIAIEFLKKRKNTERIDISSIEQRDGCWIVKGTCPIDLEGHPWAEKFEVVVDAKGKIKSTDFSLL
jgi:hypothetical protein